MKNFKGNIFIFPAKENQTKETLMEIGEHIHQQLVGNMDYVDSNIGVHVWDDSVQVWIDDCKGEIPEIRI